MQRMYVPRIGSHERVGDVGYRECVVGAGKRRERENSAAMMTHVRSLLAGGLMIRLVVMDVEDYCPTVILHQGVYDGDISLH